MRPALRWGTAPSLRPVASVRTDAPSRTMRHARQVRALLARAALRMRAGGTARLRCPAEVFFAGVARSPPGVAVRVELELLRFGEVAVPGVPPGSVLVSYQHGWGESAELAPGAGRAPGAAQRAAFSAATGHQVRGGANRPRAPAVAAVPGPLALQGAAC